jgi:uncharacterized membrane protein
MTARRWVTEYAVAALVFCALDGVWLGVVATRLYDDLMGDLLAEKPNFGAAVVFYAVLVAGLVFFVVHPAIDRGSWRFAAQAGAFFGLVTYATYDLTSLAAIEGFPFSIVVVDLAWGVVLAATVSTATYAVVSRWAPGRAAE